MKSSWNKGLKYKKSNSILSARLKRPIGRHIKKEKHYNWKGGISRNFSYRLMRNKKLICSMCKEEKIVDIHHIDGNSKNNSMKNLEFLCSSCHHIKDHRIKNIPKEKLE
jgi:5-methylcytosine-specific restriction endonuclease McrA